MIPKPTLKMLKKTERELLFQIKRLNMSFNSFEEIPNIIFEYMPFIECINAMYNQIEHFSVKLVVDLCFMG